jgi:Rieske Fe-S protein
MKNQTLEPNLNGAGGSLRRREFVRLLALGTVGSAFGLPAWVRPVWAEVRPQSAGTPGVYRLNLQDVPVLGQDFGSVLLRVPGMPTSFPQIIVTRLAGPEFFAVTSQCTHQSCTVGVFNRTTMVLQCPCHGSRYTVDGTVVRGPALLPLQRYPTSFDGVSVLQIEIPGLGFQTQGELVVADPGQTGRFKLTFPTVSGVRYRVRFRESLAAGQWLPVPFATTVDGAANQTELRGNGSPATVYVERTGAVGFYAVERF